MNTLIVVVKARAAVIGVVGVRYPVDSGYGSINRASSPSELKLKSNPSLA